MGLPCTLRLPQLVLHPTSGNAGMVENPTMRVLVGQILNVGFQTDADTMQGVERLASRPMSAMEHDDAKTMVANYGDRRANPLAPAFSVFHTKGWRRTIGANLAVALVQVCRLEADIPDNVRASFATCHSVVHPVKDLREAVERSMTITATSTATRRPVNAFNHVHQLRLLRVASPAGAS